MKHFLLTISLLFLAGCSCTGVVGVAYNQDDVVRYVFKGSPAESIGVKSGDKIVDSSKLTGEVGTMATFEIIRDSKTYKKRAKRVCVDTLSYEKPTQW